MHEGAKRQLILDAGLTQFAQFGLRKTSMQDIAEQAGISRASVYSYFKNKEEIFRCVSVDVHEGDLSKACSILRDPAEPVRDPSRQRVVCSARSIFSTGA